MVHAVSFARHSALGCVAVLATVASAACGGRQFAEVSPEEIPELRDQVSQQPNNGDLVLRLSAALFASGRCDTAMTVARTGMRLAPANAVGPLVLGQCLERATRFADAKTVYETYVTRYPDARGSPAVRARQMLAARAAAQQQARAALAREAELADQPVDPLAVAVLPLTISGDSIYAPLSRGLAQILTSDLALLERFRMVERLQLNALLDELELAQTERVDASTAARMGRLMQAGRLVQGLANIPDEANVRLEASVVQADGEVIQPEVVDGRFRDLLRMEKQLVVGLAGRLGYQLSEAERRAILENGTQNLVAFLAYSRGLEAEDLGNYTAAAEHFAQAAQADPGFQAARERYQANQAAPQVQQASAGQVTQLASQRVEPPGGFGPDPLTNSLGSTIGDLLPTASEQTTATATVEQPTVTTPAQPPPEVIATIRIVFRLP